MIDSTDVAIERDLVRFAAGHEGWWDLWEFTAAYEWIACDADVLCVCAARLVRDGILVGNVDDLLDGIFNSGLQASRALRLQAADAIW